MRMQRTSVRGVPVRWQEAGEGTPVVLVHGIPTGPDLWRHVLPRLGPSRVLNLEMVGYAGSIPAADEHDLSLAAQADHLTGWLDQLGVAGAVMVGHDLGGGVVQIAATRRPEQCAGLVLTNAVAYDSWPIPSVRAMRALPGIVAATPTRVLKLLLGTVFARGHDDTAMARRSLEVHFRHYAAHGAGRAMARQVSALDQADTLAVAGDLPRLRVPARVVWGLADQFLKAGYGERLARVLGTRPWGIRGGRHFTPEDHPDVVARAVRQVVDEVG